MCTLPFISARLAISNVRRPRSRRAQSSVATLVPMSCAHTCARFTSNARATISATSACSKSEAPKSGGLSLRPYPTKSNATT
jgi:hypothetical protein